MSFIIVVSLVAMAAILCLTQACLRKQKTIREITHQLAERQESQFNADRQIELMFSSNPYPMWTFDRASLRFMSVNDAAVDTYGYSREEFLSMTLADIRPAEDVPEFLEIVRNDPPGYLRPGIWRHRKKDGSLMFVRIMSFQYQTDGVSKEMVVAMDTTEAYLMEKALGDSEASLKTLIDRAPFGVMQTLVGEDGVRNSNSALREMLGGYAADEIAKLSVGKQIYADPKDRERFLDVLGRSGQVQGWETNFRTRSGTLVPVRITGCITTDREGRQVCSGYIEDLTQQTRLEQQVRQVQKLEAVGRLAGGMAHDFNNILVVIKLSVEMMLSQITPASAFSKPLLQISSAADRAASLTRQMLAFGRQQILQPRVINLNAVVSETTQMLRRVIGEDIQLVTNLSDKIENCRLDPSQVTQVILNLAVNARDAMPKGGSLHVETSSVCLDENYAQHHPSVQPGRYVMLAVTDTGTGIEKALQQRIFDPFFTTKEVGKGTGLGLSIVYGIVKQSGGHIWVYSELGYGTSFKIYFPATDLPIQRQLSRADADARPSGEVLLLVEDDTAIRTNLRECLQQLGYTVFEAGDAQSAIKACEELAGGVDLMITDLVMAGKNGHELAQEISDRYPQVRVLFMSGYTEDTAVRRDILLRGSPFLQKPFSVADLAKAVQDALVPATLSAE